MIAAIPIVLWPVKRLYFARSSLAQDFVVLLSVYLVVAVVYWFGNLLKHNM